MRWLIIGSSLIILLLLSLMALFDISSPFGSVATAFRGYFSSKTAEVNSVSFVGDIFLGRDVETKIRKWGSNYPFSGDMVEAGELRVANFESAAPNEHVQTPNYTFSFSVDQTLLPALHAGGVSFVSLANNHSLDFGKQAATETVKALLKNNIKPFGATATSSVIFETQEGVKLAVTGYNDVTSIVTTAEIMEAMSEISTTSDYQVAYVHWGDEYEVIHNDRQEELAKLFIDYGYDAVIGHHPHVIQDIGWYDGVPIFYSLGNYIFDQYFDEGVQTGLRLSLSFMDDYVVYRLAPVSSQNTYIQPIPLEGEQKQSVLWELARNSDYSIAEWVAVGRIEQQI